LSIEAIRSHPLAAALAFLGLFAALFIPLYGPLGEGAFIICNVLPLIFASILGMKWGLGFSLVHVAFGLVLGGIVGADFDRFVSTGIPASGVMVAMSGAVGRIRDLARSLQGELGERQRYERELQEHRAHLKSLVEERTNDLVRSNERLKQEIAERARAEAEKRLLEASLKRAEKMEAIGMVAGTVAHDLNNILGSLVGYPDLLLLELPDDSPGRGALVAIRESGLRAAAVVRDLLTMARRGITSRQVLSLNEVVSNLMTSPELLSLRAQHPNARISANLAPDLLNTHGSAVHLSKAILNLVLNGLEALVGDGAVTISTANVDVDALGDRYEVVAKGAYVTVRVEDNGRGIPPADLERIFEPFYTRKVMGRSGTGLGMAIVWGTVKDHDGFVDVRSDEGMGTTFTLFLPATTEAVQVEPVTVHFEEYRGHGESVLVVDDVQPQRDLCAALLRKLGYSVTTVASGEEAIEHLTRSSVDLLILDMVMEPGLDGLETYRRILETHPGQKAVIASGFSESALVGEAQALGAGAYIRKPFTLETLAVVVRDELVRRG
jgi:two-component system, cell cycle sensor histidine kinase and response regulator CckA